MPPAVLSWAYREGRETTGNTTIVVHLSCLQYRLPGFAFAFVQAVSACQVPSQRQAVCICVMLQSQLHIRLPSWCGSSC